MSKEAMKLALDLATMHHTDEGYDELRSKVRVSSKEALAKQEQPYAHEAAMYSNDRMTVDPQTGYVSIGTIKQEQGEPVAWVVEEGGDSILIRHSEKFPGIFAGSEFRKRPLFYGDTTPQQRKPLTDEQITSIANEVQVCPDWTKLFARAIEAAHGIKE